MFGVALLTIALLALAEARIYERCELAQDLLSLGIRREHLATWVCIAFHESRFDTAARNPHSGDHGILQISEIYWCGAGKVCGLPCSALRDDDIADDVECALRIHEEHTRLQGNGFLAWVVYPQHCKHNAKKYLADCESSVKTPLLRIDARARVLKPQNRNVTSFSYNPKIDELLPPYLAIGSIFRGNYEKEFEKNYNNKIKIDWVNYKIHNIDDLKLPVFNEKFTGEYTTTTLATTTTTSPSPLPKIKPPSPRRIESNSFRRRKMRPIFEPVKLIETTVPSRITITTVTPRNIYRSNKEILKNPENSLQFTTTTNVPLIITTTNATSKIPEFFSSLMASTTASVEQETTNSPMFYTTNPVQTARFTQDTSTQFVDKSSSTISSMDQKTTTSPVNHSLIINKTRSSFFDLKTNLPGMKSNYYTSFEPRSTLSSTTTAPTVKNDFIHFGRHTSRSWFTTSRPWSKTWQTWTTTPKSKTIITSTTQKSSSTPWWTEKKLSTVSVTNEGISTKTSKNQSTTSNPWRKTRVFVDSKTPVAELLDSKSNTGSTSTLLIESTTTKSYSTTATVKSPSTANPTVDVKSTAGTITSTEIPFPTTARTTQSIFDLYLNPTKRPKITPFSFPPFKNRAFSLQIFAGGTTTHAPNLSRSEAHESASNEAAKNQIRRQTT